MSCNRCRKQPCDCDPCGKKCKPAKYGCGFDIQIDPFDPSTWIVTTGGATRRLKVPKAGETDTLLKTDYSGATLNYKSERHTDIITGKQLGSIINLNELRNVDAPDPENCSFLTWNPGCSECGHGCTPLEAKWRPYTIPDAGDDDIAAVDDNGYYHVLGKNDCGCVVEKKVPIVPSGMTSLNYERDSEPDDPDFPWYYGCYNDTINLHLAENAPQYFGKYDLKVTVNYGVQAIKSDRFTFNYNWRSLVVPQIEGDILRTTTTASILQNWAAVGSFTTSGHHFPWGTSSLRGSFTFIVPKGKEASLHHEYRIRVAPSDMQYGKPVAAWPEYLKNSDYDGRIVPNNEATLNSAKWPASRLNALQVIIEPTVGTNNYDPAKDTIRNQLDAPEDSYNQSN